MRSIIICICVKSSNDEEKSKNNLYMREVSNDKERLLKTRNVYVLVVFRGVYPSLRLTVLAIPFCVLKRGMYKVMY